MEVRNTQTAARPFDFNTAVSVDRDDALAQKRLDALLAVNAETAREKSLFSSERERNEAALMGSLLTDEQAFALFGSFLGTIPPVAIFARLLMNSGNFRVQDFWIISIVAIVCLLSATVGYFSGKLVGKIVGELEKLSWSKMLVALPFIGLLWGFLAGGAGGVIIFVFGAIFGAMFGAAVGGAALPIFTVFHRLLKKGDAIERRLFLPLAVGTAFIISAFILGLNP